MLLWLLFAVGGAALHALSGGRTVFRRKISTNRSSTLRWLTVMVLALVILAAANTPERRWHQRVWAGAASGAANGGVRSGTRWY